jgi:hypothetical protein
VVAEQRRQPHAHLQDQLGRDGVLLDMLDCAGAAPQHLLLGPLDVHGDGRLGDALQGAGDDTQQLRPGDDAGLACPSKLAEEADVVLGEHRCIGVGHADADVAVSGDDGVDIDARPDCHVTGRQGCGTAEHQVGRKAAQIVHARRSGDLLGGATEGLEPFAHRGFLSVVSALVVVHRQARYGARPRLRRVSGSNAAP